MHLSQTASHLPKIFALTLALGLSYTAANQAATRQWKAGVTTGSWGVGGAGGNWTTNASPFPDAAAPVAADIAAFANITSDTLVTLDANQTITRINVNNSNLANVTITNGTGGPWTLTLADAAQPVLSITNNRTLTIDAVLAGTQGFDKLGNGVVYLKNASNNLTGGIKISAGPLQFASGALGSNLITVVGTNADLNWGANIVGESHSQDISSQILLNDGSVLTLNNYLDTTLATAFQTQSVNGTGRVIKAQNTTVTFTGANTYTGGTRINNGTIALEGGDNRLSALGGVELGNNGVNSAVLRLGGGDIASNQTLTSLVVTTGNTGTNNRVLGGATTISTLTLNNSTDQTYTGRLGGGGTNANNLAFTKTGTGTYTLTNASNTYLGPTDVQQGTLALTSTAIILASDITVRGTAAIDNLGTIEKNVSLVDDATFHIGKNALTGLAINKGNLTLASTSKVYFDIAGINRGAAVDGYDAIDGLTDLALNGTFCVSLTNALFTPQAGQTFNLINWSTLPSLEGSSYAFNFDAANVSTYNLTWDTSTFATTGNISLAGLAPEPTRALLLSLAATIGLLVRRRKHPIKK